MRQAFILLLFVSLLFAANPLTKLTSALNDLCAGVSSLLPVAAMLMVVLGAVIYASGQMMGAETRARANVWATAALTGALTSMLIASITPAALGAIYGSSVSCAGGGTTPANNCPASGPVIYCSDTCCKIGNDYVCKSSNTACQSSGGAVVPNS